MSFGSREFNSILVEFPMWIWQRFRVYEYACGERVCACVEFSILAENSSDYQMQNYVK